MAAPGTLVTTDELLAFPDDGVRRWLVRGELREEEMPVRNRVHCQVTTAVATELENWRRAQPEPQGRVLTGDAGVRLERDPDTTVGADLAYVSADVLARQTDETSIVDGIPTLVVEILSPSDTQERVHDKRDEYLAAGVPLLWVIDPRDRTVWVYRPDAGPQLFNDRQELAGDPHLPGFRVPVAKLFE